MNVFIEHSCCLLGLQPFRISAQHQTPKPKVSPLRISGQLRQAGAHSEVTLMMSGQLMRIIYNILIVYRG